MYWSYAPLLKESTITGSILIRRLCTVLVGCVWDKEAKQQHIAQVEICIDKQFRAACNGKLMKNRRLENMKIHQLSDIAPVDPCRSSEKICYFPIPH